MEESMLARIILVAAVATLTTVTPATARDLYIYWSDGSVTHLTPQGFLLLFVGLLLSVLALIYNIYGIVTSYQVSVRPRTDESYQQEAERIRAMAQKIDAEAQLAESYINAMRTRAHLEEAPEIRQHEQAKRRR